MIDTLFTGQAVKRVFLCPDPASIRLIPHSRITTVLLGGAAAANSVGKVKAQQAFPVFCSGLASRHFTTKKQTRRSAVFNWSL